MGVSVVIDMCAILTPLAIEQALSGKAGLRFKSCLLDSGHYLFSLYRHIEMNPVKAK